MIKKLLIVQNSIDWPSMPQKIQALKTWFAPCVNLQIDTTKTDFSNIPFVKYSGALSNNPTVDPNLLKGIDPVFYDQHFTGLGLKYDIILVVLPMSQWPYDDQARGWRGDADQGPVQLHIACDETEHLLWFGHDSGDMFHNLARHEILHALYLITGQEDKVHYWWNQDPEMLRNCLTEIDFDYKAKQMTFLRKLIQLYQQLINLMKTQQYPKIEKMCKAIQSQEGWYAGSRSYRNNNPGNLRYIGQSKSTGKDTANFAVFATYEDGLDTLRQMLIRACSGQSQLYRPTMTITQFFQTYAPASDKNKPIEYAQKVAQAIGVDASVQIKSLLT